VSNYPLSYKLSWPLRFLKPSLGGNVPGFLPAQGEFLPPPQRSARLAFVGDISAVANRRPPECDAGLRQLLASADLVIGNCESPVVERPTARLGMLVGSHHAMSAQFLEGALGSVGISHDRLVLSLANNHVLDQGIGGYDETLAALAKLGIATTGTDVAARKVAVGPLTLALVAFTQWRNADAQEFAGRVGMAEDFFAGCKSVIPGCEGVDLICAVPHWDWEFRHFPRPQTRAWAERLAELGVGLAVGHHAHVVQPVERIGDTLVAYGVGDFFGTAFARQPWPGRIGAIMVAEISADDETRGQVASYRMVPFARLRAGDRERLLQLEAVPGAAGERMRQRWDAIFAGG